jgi:hypothetical protein
LPRAILEWLIWLLLFSCVAAAASLQTGESGAAKAQEAGTPLAPADAEIRFGPRSAWSARTRSGMTLGGTWTCVIDPAAGTASGTWTLRDRENRVVLRGTWSAAKAAREWRGAWRALVAGRNGEFSGTWTATAELPPETLLAGMFEQAVSQLVSGTWQSGSQSGSWSIRAVR